LSQLVAARICHDLSGPLSGLGAALGEAEEDPGALDLAQDAALVLRQRLALFRAAWGGQPAPLSRAVLRDLAGGLPNAPRLHLDLDGLADTGAFSPRAAPVLAGALLLAAESLSGGGKLDLSGWPSGVVVLTIAGPRAAWPGGLAAMLASAEAAWEAIGQLAPPAGLRALPAPLVALLAREAGVAAELLAPQKPDQPAPLQLDFSGMGSV
jgi:histidine phosphotransferase ChpT